MYQQISLRVCTWVLTFLLFSPASLVGQVNTHTITITEIEYENTALNQLKESLKKNIKVKSVKSAYTNGTATITFTSASSAEDIWDGIPVAIKKKFKLSTIDDTQIAISPVSAQKSTTPAATKTVSSNNTPNNQKGNQDCKACAYFPICDYDYTRTFQGKEYKGIDYDGRIIYYRYENGDLVSKTELFDEWGISQGFSTEIILKCNAQKGTTWQSAMTGGIFTSGKKEYKVLEKGISLEVDGERYNDVLKVSETITMENALSDGGVSAKVVNYYAKGIGLVKQENPNLGDIFSQVFPNNPINKENSNNETGNDLNNNAGNNVQGGVIDNSIVGTWKHYQAAVTVGTLSSPAKEMYYKFFSDGTFEYYEGGLAATNRLLPGANEKSKKCNWKRNGDFLELLFTDGRGQKIQCIKKNDPQTGKPALELQVQDIYIPYRLFISQDNKKPW